MLRSSWSSSQGLHPFGEFAYKTLHNKKVVTLAMDYPYGWEVVGGFQKSFEQAGGHVIQKLWAPLGLEDFFGADKVHTSGADAVLIAVWDRAPTSSQSSTRSLDSNCQSSQADQPFEEINLHRFGDASIGAISVHEYSASLDTPANRNSYVSYRTRYGCNPSAIAESAYTSAMWIHRAVDKLHGNIEDKEKLLAALKSVESLDAPRGSVKTG